MRIDKFLKVSRILKRRTVAGDACKAGKVVVNGREVKPACQLKIGDVVELKFSAGEPEIPRARAQRNGEKGRGVLAVRDHRRRGLIMKISAVVPAAGAGARAGFSKNKLLTFFRGEPVLYRTVSALSACESIGEIVIAAAKRDIAEISAMFEKFANVRAVCGGDTRTQSVLFALRACDSPDYVLIHDGARPFVTRKFKRLHRNGARARRAVCAPARHRHDRALRRRKDREHPDRSALYALQTPQAFSYAEILAAYEKIGGETFTDDSGVYAKFVAPPQIFAGDVKNKKLTFREDFLSDPLPAPRVGVGIDTHAFGKAQDHIVLGGARIPSESGLIAHSDGDVLVHAVMDALLSAAALPDIGHFFPRHRPAFADADSLRLLERVRDLLAEKGFAPRNVSAAIQAERPRLQKYIFSMRENIAARCVYRPTTVGLSAGTQRGFGLRGRRERDHRHRIRFVDGNRLTKERSWQRRNLSTSVRNAAR